MKKIMNFFKNHTQKERLQSLKKEQVVEMVKTNKVPILLVGFALFVMIAFGILISGMGRQEKEQENLFLEEQAQLLDMTTYLDEIENVVSTNKERLSESMVFQSDTEQTLTTVQENLLLLEQDLMQIEKILQSHSQTETVINNEVSTALKELSLSQQEIKAQIATVNAEITELLSNVKQENEESFSHTFDKLKTLQKSLDQTQKDVKSYYEDLTEFLTLLQEENTEHFTLTFEKLEQLKEDLLANKEEGDKQNEALREFLTLLQEEDNGNAAITFEKLENLKETLEAKQEKDKEYYESITEFLSLVKEANNRQKEELAKQLLSVQTQINEILEFEFDSLQLKLEEDYLSLMQEMENMQRQVESTHVSITELLNLMEEADESRQEEIKAAFADVNASIEQIRTEYQNAHANLENLIQTVQETQMVNHEETLSVLSEVEINLEEVSMESLEQLSNSLQVIEENFTDSMTQMKQEMNQNFSNLSVELKNNLFQTNTDIVNKLDEMNSSIFNQHEELETNISNQYQQITTTINNSSGNQQDSFDSLMSYLEQKLGQVFTFVSNGKKKVVSALLTKGVNLNEDATFAQIHDAILSIEQELLIGVEQIPGDITYDYHYHVNGKGQYPHTATCAIADKGGCYGVPVYHYHTDVAESAQNASYITSKQGGCFTAILYHSHTGSMATGGGCYSTPVYHKHTGSSSSGGGCYSKANMVTYISGYVEERKPCPGYTSVNGDPDGSVYQQCTTCGAKYTGGTHDNGIKCWKTLTVQVPQYASRQEGWLLNCGKIAGTTLDGFSLGCGKTTTTIDGYKLGCGKTTSTIVAYQPGCGLSDGQIIGATIVYDQSAVSTMNMEHIQEEAVVENMASSEELILPPEKVTVSGNEIPPENTMDHQEEMKPTEDSVLEDMIENDSETSVETETEETAEEVTEEVTEEIEPETEVTEESTEDVTEEATEESSNEEETDMSQEQMQTEQAEPEGAVAENVTETVVTEEMTEDIQTEVQEEG